MENLKELVAINSSENGEEIIEYLKQRFLEQAKEVQIVKNKENENKSILVGINTPLKDINPVVLAGHIDTVKPDKDKYKTNPFELTEIDGNCYGLGSIDMKSFTAVILDNIEYFKNHPLPIVLAPTTDEETDLLCIENVIEKMKELSIKPTFSIIGEPTSMQIKTSANGCYEYSIEFFGKSCHSSVVNLGINSICILAKIISFIETEQAKFENLTSNPGIICGGDIVNRVPDYAKLTFDIRSTSKDEVNSFLSAIQEKISELEKEYNATSKLTKLLEIPPLQDKQSPIICGLVKQLNLEIGKFSGGCEAGYLQTYSGDAILFGVGDLNLAHKPNEFVVKKEYKIYTQKLIEMFEILKKQKMA